MDEEQARRFAINTACGLAVGMVALAILLDSCPTKAAPCQAHTVLHAGEAAPCSGLLITTEQAKAAMSCTVKLELTKAEVEAERELFVSRVRELEQRLKSLHDRLELAEGLARQNALLTRPAPWWEHPALVAGATLAATVAVVVWAPWETW